MCGIYRPAHFRENRPDVLHGLIRAYTRREGWRAR
jgi:predicted FMN-binding regulatory protein PaiB